MNTARHNDPTLLWAPRRQLTLAQARERSVFVKRLRMLFVACAAVSIGFFLGHIIKSAISSDARPVQIDETQAVTMKNPRFSGRDAAGTAFTIIAEAAERQRGKSDAVDLIGPILRDALGTEVRAPSGMYNAEAGILELYGDVSIKEVSGYTFLTKGARVFVNENRVEGLSPLMGKGPLGDIRADSYQVLDGGNHLIFTDNVKTTIYPEPRASVKPDESE
jgi:lipopolysaccharide export system protein LptC